jgi:CubicO group peptidase (beta-lactamase class C family)
VVKIGYLYRQKYSAFICIIICLFLSCAPRANRWGLPQYEYTYQVPEKIDDDWKTSDLKAEGVDPKRINELMGNILKGDIKNIHSILLVKNGKLIFEEYFYGIDRDTKHIMYSASKSITSILVGIAMDQKMIPNVDQKAYAFLPEYKGTKWVDQKYDITLKHVLTMSAGIDWEHEKYPHHDARNSTGAMTRSGDWIKFVLDRDMIERPGDRFNYSDGLTMLLGVIIKNSTDMYADEFAVKHLFSPLGISDYSWEKSPGGSVITAWGLSLKHRDIAKIGYLFLKNGRWNGKQIVSQKWVNESTKAHMTQAHMKDVPIGSGFGYQWWCGKTNINNQVYELYYAAGMGGQYIFVCPSLNLVAVITSSTIGNPLGELRPQAMMTDYILPAILPPAPSPKTIKLDPKTVDRYVGKYKSNYVTLIIFRKGDKLFVTTPYRTHVELFPESEYRFFGIFKEIGDIQLDFTKDEKGNIQKVTVHIGFGRIQCEKIQ